MRRRRRRGEDLSLGELVADGVKGDELVGDLGEVVEGQLVGELLGNTAGPEWRLGERMRRRRKREGAYWTRHFSVFSMSPVIS